jgi:hypothetical protein
MSVESTFDIKSRSGPVLAGKIERGAVGVGDLPTAEGPGSPVPVRLVGIETFEQNGLEYAEAGEDSVAIEVVGITAEQATQCHLLTGRSSRHEERPQPGPHDPSELARRVEALLASEYYQLVSPLLAEVAGKRITGSRAGHSGFIVFLKDNTWVASFLRG